MIVEKTYKKAAKRMVSSFCGSLLDYVWFQYASMFACFRRVVFSFTYTYQTLGLKWMVFTVRFGAFGESARVLRKSVSFLGARLNRIYFPCERRRSHSAREIAPTNFTRSGAFRISRWPHNMNRNNRERLRCLSREKRRIEICSSWLVGDSRG